MLQGGKRWFSGAVLEPSKQLLRFLVELSQAPPLRSVGGVDAGWGRGDFQLSGTHMFGESPEPERH